VNDEISPLGPGEELIDAESFERLHSGIPDQWPGGLPAPPEIELVDRLTRQHVERIAVQRARGHADAVAFFLAWRGRILATCCDPEPPRRPSPIRCSGRRSPLASVLEQQRPYCGAPWPEPLTNGVLRSLGREGVREIALVPIVVYARPVAFLYADAGWKALPAGSLMELSAIGSCVADVFERLIVERKRDEACASGCPLELPHQVAGQEKSIQQSTRFS
jgi:hypothetical protein